MAALFAITTISMPSCMQKRECTRHSYRIVILFPSLRAVLFGSIGSPLAGTEHTRNQPAHVKRATLLAPRRRLRAIFSGPSSLQALLHGMRPRYAELFVGFWGVAVRSIDLIDMRMKKTE
jgi:hypothetical protein